MLVSSDGLGGLGGALICHSLIRIPSPGALFQRELVKGWVARKGLTSVLLHLLHMYDGF